MTSKRNFLKQFLKDKQMVGAVSPSTRFLCDKMLEHVDFKNSKLIIELGPGTGVFTEEIIKRMRPDAKFLIFELNDNFYVTLNERIKDPRVQLIHDSAEHISKYLPENEKHNTDVIISSLPLMVFPEILRKKVVLESRSCLKIGGIYIQFQYSLQSKKLLEAIYENVKVKFTIKNFPPAFVYACVKKK
jgi:phospholipid N-methyltransferase